MPSNAMQQARRKLGFERTQAFLGKLNEDGNQVIRDDSGLYFVRAQLPSGALAPPVALPLDRGTFLPSGYNLAVEVGYDKTGQQVILGIDYETAKKQGISPAALNPADPAASGFTRIGKLADLLCRAHPGKEGYAQVFPGICIFGTTIQKYDGGEISILASYKPSSGNHRYVVVALTSGGALEAAGSTAQSTSSALDETDLQQAINGLSSNSKPLKAFRVAATDSVINDSPYHVDRNPNGAIDLRLYGPQGATSSTGTAIYPTRSTLFADEFIYALSGSAVTAIDATHRYGFYTNNAAAPANGDSFSVSFLLKAGTYTLKVLGQTASDQGIIDFALDGGSVAASQDWYAGSGAANVEKSSGSIVVSGSGRHKLTGTINGKHASSSSYAFRLTKIWFVPSSDTSET